MADSANTIYKRILWSWRNWQNSTIRRKYGRKCKRKFNKVSREEIGVGVEDYIDECMDFDQGVDEKQPMFFDESNTYTGD